MTDMTEEIRGFIAETSFTDPGEINENTMLFDEGIFDSMGLLNLITFLEEKYDVQTTDIDMIEDNFQSLGAIKDYVIRKRGG